VNAQLDELLRRADVWRPDARGATAHPHVATGFTELDAQLATDGWPSGALTELLLDGEGIGELHLLMPALARLAQAGRWVVWVDPPYLPYAPALKFHGIDLSYVLWIRGAGGRESLWAAEQALRTPCCGAVLMWPDGATDRALRRLQLAAEAGGSWGVLFRRAQTQSAPSPAALRLQLSSAPDGLSVCIRKCRGRAPGASVCIPLQ